MVEVRQANLLIRPQGWPPAPQEFTLVTKRLNSTNQRLPSMKSPTTKNVHFDEAHDLTYIVMAHRVLTDGEMFSAIRLALLKRGGKHPAKGESLVITSAVAN